MNNFNLSDEKVNSLIQLAAQKLGQNPEQLKQQLQSGDLNSITQNMDAGSAGKINSLLNDPKALETVLKNDKIQSLLRGMNGGK